MNFTNNEKKVLKLLLDNGRISDVDMAKELRISTQALGKIRKKLEETGVIEGYTCNLNFEKLKLNHFSLAITKFNDKYWQEMGELRSLELMKNNPKLLFSCMPSGSEVSLITLHAFRDSKEMDRYFHLNKVRNSKYHEIVHMYHFSPLNLLKINPKDVFKFILDNKMIVPEELMK